VSKVRRVDARVATVSDGSHLRREVRGELVTYGGEIFQVPTRHRATLAWPAQCSFGRLLPSERRW